MAHDEDGRSPSSEDEAPVKSLIQGREKRSTAGLNMSALLNAEADDDLALLFEEVEDDNEFAEDAGEEGADDEEMGLDSSSDEDDDQGPNAAADELEGEKQLEKEERAEKKKRRARENLRYKIVSKKVKIDPTAVSAMSATPAPRPKKKSERVSWIPTLEDGPTRSSSRRQTMQNKELTHARLKDSEEKRIRLIATMEEAAKRKAKFKPKEMTQAERLVEAERVERLNSKSLNRWEEMEKRKAEERRAKIEALQNRRLEGPVMSYWSGVATWVDGRLTRVGKVDITPKPEKEDNTRKKSKKSEKEAKAGTEQKPEETALESRTSQTVPPTSLSETSTDQKQSTQVVPKSDPAPAPSDNPSDKMDIDSDPKGDAPTENKPDADPEASKTSPAPKDTPAAGDQPQPSTPATHDVPNSGAPVSSATQKVDEKNQEETSSAPPTSADLEGGDPSMVPAVEAAKETSTSQDASQVTAETSAPETSEQSNPEPSLKEEEKPNDASKEPNATSPASLPPGPVPSNVAITPASEVPAATTQPDQQNEVQPPAQQGHEDLGIYEDNPEATNDESQKPPHTPLVEHTGRFLTVLENFDEKTAQSREYSIYFNAKKPPRLTKISSSLCVITSLPSRYRDPDTTLPFANSYAYHEIRHTASQKYQWSPMLGCYVGPVGVAARGVPARFLGEEEKEESDKKPDNDGKPTAPETGKDSEPKAASTINPGTSTSTSTSAPVPAPITTPAPTAAGAGDAMEVDK